MGYPRARAYAALLRSVAEHGSSAARARALRTPSEKQELLFTRPPKVGGNRGFDLNEGTALRTLVTVDLLDINCNHWDDSYRHPKLRFPTVDGEIYQNQVFIPNRSEQWRSDPE